MVAVSLKKFFFQAEDGIRDSSVTGVQTCALPICRDITGLSTKKILEAGINFVPEDRHNHGLFKIRSISSNTTSALLGSKEIGKVNMDRRRQKEISQKYVDDFRTKIVSLDDLIGSLSGGNQQKVVIARSL